MTDNQQRAAELLRSVNVQPEFVPTVRTAIADALDKAEAWGRAEALLDAADAWQQGAWAVTPRRRDWISDGTGAAQYVTDWLRARALGVDPA